MIKDMNGVAIKTGDTVYWHDPDNEICSGSFTVTYISEQDGDDPILLVSGAGGLVEVFASECEKIAEKVMKKKKTKKNETPEAMTLPRGHTGLVIGFNSEIPDDAIAVYTSQRHRSDGHYCAVTAYCYNESDLNRIRNAVKRDDNSHYFETVCIEVRTRYWTQKFYDFDTFDGEVAYILGDDGSFGDFEDQVERDAKYVCWYTGALIDDFKEACTTDELMRFIKIAGRFREDLPQRY